MATYSFSTALERSPTDSSWLVITVPPDVSQALAAGGQARVSGTIGGQPFRGALRPYGDGRHYLVVNKAIRHAAGVTEGDAVQVALEMDAEEEELAVPPDLAAVLNGNPGAAAAFTRLAPSHRREFVAWLDEIKNPDTRQRRLGRVMEMLTTWNSPKSVVKGNIRSRGGRT